MKKNFEMFGNYILLEKLAAGGMAEVYLAKKMAADGVQKFVAVKRILSQYSHSEDFISMFKDEARIAINLSHSNVVSIYDFGTENGQLFIVMEFVEGRNLRQVLNQMKKINKFFSVAQVVHIIKQVAAGLDHAHRCIDPTTGQSLNIIHRDTSPQNVMLSFDGAAKVVDFGIAKAAHQIESTRTGTLKGKFGYMSPEQVESESVDLRTDIFALGIMIWEMLANQRLFLANNEMNTLRKIRQCHVPNLRTIDPNIPTELAQIVNKALEKDKVDRYQSAGDMQRDLQSFLSRFDPDFSVQDLSIFVKGLFSEEIIQTRKKQIAYAQVSGPQAESTMEATEVITAQSPNKYKDDFSHEHLSFEDLSQESTIDPAGPLQMQQETLISGGESQPDTTKGIHLHEMKRVSQKKVPDYQSQIYTDTKSALKPKPMDKNNYNATLFTVLFSLSFVLVFFAYINKYHPQFKARFCKSMEAYGICPRSAYIPANLLSIDTGPSGAHIYLNGQMLGVTPKEVFIKRLPAKIDIHKNGYRKESTVLKAIPKNNKLSIGLTKVPTGYLIVKSVGVQIYINGVTVPSGRRMAVPAHSDVLVRVVNPLTKQSRQRTVRVKPKQTRAIVMQPPTSRGRK